MKRNFSFYVSVRLKCRILLFVNILPTYSGCVIQILNGVGHTRVVALLLNRGALLHRDHNGRNPLHLSAMSGYTQTMELLHSVHSHLLDQVDKDGVCRKARRIHNKMTIFG